MNPSHGNMPYECNPNFSWSSQNPPSPLINYPQNQSFDQYMNNNQNPPTFPTNNPLDNNQYPTFLNPNNSFPFLPFQTLESAPYQPQETLAGIPFSFQTPPSLPVLNSILVPDNSPMVVRRVIGEIESGSGSFKNSVRELYIGSYEHADQDPYYSIRKMLIIPFFPYLEVTGCWPNEEDDVGAEVNSAGNTRKSRKKKINLFSCITWNLSSTSNIPNPERPIPKTPKNLKFLFMKELCESDVNNLKRIILPKSEAESHLPSLVEKTGIKMLMRDVLLSITWRLKFRFWYNNRSRIYVLEHAGDFVKKHELKCGDAIALYQDETNQIYIYANKKDSPSSSSHQVINPPSGQEINMTFPNPIENLQNNGLDVGEPSAAQQGPANFDLSNFLKGIEESLFDEYGPIPTNYNNSPISTNYNNGPISTNYNYGLNVGEPSFSQEGFMNFNVVGEPMFDEHNAISTTGLINAETFFAQEGLLMESNSVSTYLNERHEVSPIFDQYDPSRVDLRPANQDDFTIFK